MSRRRQHWAAHTPATTDELLAHQFGRQSRRVKHPIVIPPASDAEDRREQAITRLLLGAVGMFCVGVLLMSLWPLALATFGGAP